MACVPQVVQVEAVAPSPYILEPGTAFSVRARFAAPGVDGTCTFRINWNVVLDGVKTTFANEYPATPGISYIKDYTPTQPGAPVINAEVFYLGG